MQGIWSPLRPRLIEKDRYCKTEMQLIDAAKRTPDSAKKVIDFRVSAPSNAWPQASIFGYFRSPVPVANLIPLGSRSGIGR